ncbi:immediate early response 3-interacting 1-like [Olea europaea subsp. europaea]|uniref:Immediate early response 3-interacting 1-like n=1 Tax=Olea europaea subsp. europaea TaxID=158383 RepID=A0A8S0PN11_OLEEU|nr:immediate early response 3-interacting 1-like [Olea europaea subsp. europaea]
MMQEMGLWTLLEGCLLLANALAILNEDRLLAPRGWSFQEYSAVFWLMYPGMISVRGLVLLIRPVEKIADLEDSVNESVEKDVCLEKWNLFFSENNMFFTNMSFVHFSIFTPSGSSIHMVV